jgi:hypothetical protein
MAVTVKRKKGGRDYVIDLPGQEFTIEAADWPEFFEAVAGRPVDRVKTYEHTIALGDVRVSEVESVVEMLREFGHPKLNFSSTEPLLPVSVTVDWEVGHENGIADLWDLREIIEEIEANLSSYGTFKLGKPKDTGV